MSKRRRESEGDVLTKKKLKRPRKYKVILLNDDYTSMEFVVWILQSVFKHSPASATRVMLHIHRSGIGVAGVYTREIAETRLDQTMTAAREGGYPLQATMEPE